MDGVEFKSALTHPREQQREDEGLSAELVLKAVEHWDQIEDEIRTRRTHSKYTMRVPAEKDNDSDFLFEVMAEAARRYARQSSGRGEGVENVITVADIALTVRVTTAMNYLSTNPDSDDERRTAIATLWQAANRFNEIVGAVVTKDFADISEPDRLYEAMVNINACASDAGNSKGKTGCEWIAATCREISEAALTPKESKAHEGK